MKHQHSTIGLGVALTMAITGCAPSDPVDRMFYDIGYKGRAGLTMPPNFTDSFGPFGGNPSRYKEGCGAYLYEGPGARPGVLPPPGLHPIVAALNAKEKSRRHLPSRQRLRLDVTDGRVIQSLSPAGKIALELFPELRPNSLDARAVQINVEPDVAAKRLIAKLGLPRFAFSHNIRGCHTGLSIIYAALDHPKIATDRSIEVSNSPPRPVGSCQYPSMDFNFMFSGNEVITSYGDTASSCYVNP